MTRTIVVVGASVAGVRTAQALRSSGFDGRVVLLGEEAEEPYDRPPLSKQFLAGTASRESVALLTAEQAAAAGVELRRGVAAKDLDVDRNEVVLADGARVGFDACVIATGAAARPSPWAAPGVHVLRRMQDSRALREALLAGGRVAVVGAGFIGAEVASTARALGCEVTAIDPLPIPIAKAVGPAIGALLADLPSGSDVETRFGVGVGSIQARPDGLHLSLSDGEVHTTDTVVVGIGAVPNDGWLASAGLSLGDGVICDRHCRALGTENVFAAGDVARWYHEGYGEHVRVEHWTNAASQAACVAHNLISPHDLRAYRPIEYVWSDQYGVKLQIAGRVERTADHHLVGDLRNRFERAAILGKDETGRFSGAVTVNWPRAQVECRRLLTLGLTFSRAVAMFESTCPLSQPMASDRGNGGH